MIKRKLQNVSNTMLLVIVALLMTVSATYVLAVLTDATDESVATMKVVAASRMMSAVDPVVNKALSSMGFGKAGYSQAGDAQKLGGECFGQLKSFVSGGNVVPGKGSPGINPTLACRLVKLFKDYPCGKIISGYRSVAKQRSMCGANGKKSGCARPGRSCHQYGLAVDVKGCVAKLRKIIPKRSNNKYKLHFAYYGPHIQCIENRVAACSPNTKPCGGNSPDPTRQGQGGMGKPDGRRQPQPQGGGQPSGGGDQGGGGSGGEQSGEPQGGGAPQGGQQPQQDPRNEHPYSHSGGGTKPYNPYDAIWGGATSTDSTKEQAVASITCDPQSIAAGERALIEWRCSGASTRSRGGTSLKGTTFDTKGRLRGRGYARPRIATGYKVQCLAGDRVVGEAVCRVTLDGSIDNSNDDDASEQASLHTGQPVLHLSVLKRSVSWGAQTVLEWATLGAQRCELRGGGLKESGLSGLIETNKIYHPTTFVLQCNTAKGSKSAKVVVKVK